jgi:hypothetical protein
MQLIKSLAVTALMVAPGLATNTEQKSYKLNTYWVSRIWTCCGPMLIICRVKTARETHSVNIVLHQALIMLL